MSSPLDKVTVVSVTFQSAGLAQALSATLARFPHVIVVDNASRDGTADALAARLPGARILRNRCNSGFGPANNKAMAEVHTPYALLLNPDCEITPEALARLVETAETFPDAALVAPQAWTTPGCPQPSYRHAFYENSRCGDYRIPDGTVSAKWLHGCCQLVRVDAFRAFGGFDERFFLYYEDDDLCLRALKAGYDCLLEPAAQVMHAGGASSSPCWRIEFSKNFHFFRSRHLIIGKYQGLPAARRYLFRTAIAAPLAAVLYTLLLRRKYALKWLAWGVSAWSMPSFLETKDDRHA